ncbi:AraC family transcriptional regulator [Kiritimatiellota bacterium B12222]|nr:AraC family transcriptional regulator [Kiritimatiellota bacterium B12222]
MDILINHWRPIPRRFPSRFRVATLGHLRKGVEDQMRSASDTLNFSFILDGGGRCRRGEENIDVKAPSVLMEWPGEYLEYGPSEKYGFWEEFYLIYDRNQVPDFLSAGLIQSGAIYRELGKPEQARKWMSEIVRLTRGEASSDKADRLDRLCELLIVDSFSSVNAVETSSVEQLLREIHQKVMREIRNEPDFEMLARQAGLSYSSFRRHWGTLFGLPPRRSLIRGRIDKACELLVNTSLSVSEVSEAVGFNDPLYFSRSFHRETGVSATQYRSRYKAH